MKVKRKKDIVNGKNGQSENCERVHKGERLTIYFDLFLHYSNYDSKTKNLRVILH